MNEVNTLTEKIIGAAIRVHRELGPGLLESAYEACLAFELIEQSFSDERQKPLPLVYRRVQVECGFQIDLLVENAVVIELKAVDAILPIHEAQLLSYLKMSGCSVGLILNFNVVLLRDGIKRMVHGLPD